MKKRLLNIFRLGVKELQSLWQDKIMVILIVYSFSFAIYISATATTTELHKVPIAFVDQDRSMLSARIIDAFYGPRFLAPVLIDPDSIDTGMDAGIYTFVIAIPPSFEKDMLRGNRPSLQLNIDATRMTQAGIGAGYIQQMVNDEVQTFLHGNKAGSGLPVELVTRMKFNPALESVWFGSVMEFIEQVSLLSIILSGAALIREREHGTLEHLMVMPLGAAEIMLSKIWSMGAVVLAASAFCLQFVIKGVLEVPIAGSEWLFLFGALLMLFATTSMGIFMGTVARSMPQLGLIIIITILPLHAETWSFVTDNDIVFNSDDVYTGGANIAWTGDELNQSAPESFDHAYTGFISRTLSRLFPVDFEGKRLNGSINLQEMIITPKDINETDPVYDDVPYAGILALNFSLFAWNHREFEEFRVSLGVIGPLSGAEHIQKGIHTITGSVKPMGWHNQLDNHPFVGLNYLRGIRHYEYDFSNGTRVEWFNSYNADIGNMFIGAGGSTLLRYGKHIPDNFNSNGSLMTSSFNHHLGFASRAKAPGWAVNVGLSIAGIGYFYFYDESERLGYEYSRSRWGISGRVGLDLYLDNWQISAEIYPTRTAARESLSSSWGRLTLTWTME